MEDTTTPLPLPSFWVAGFFLAFNPLNGYDLCMASHGHTSDLPPVSGTFQRQVFLDFIPQIAMI